ncbi:MAG TPA: LPS-assembly protein LptD [Burkholderiales bacterium]|nr:LPS-assembly protein LptD [Burkholderiales bacterium]
MALRLATLALALAVAAPAAAQTAKPDAAQAKPPDPDADRTVIEADIIEGVSDLEVSARGNAEIRRDDMTIFGETLRYNRELGRAEGDGGVRLQRGADRFFGPRLYYNTLDDTGVVESPTYLLERDRTARGSAERLDFLGPHRYRMTNATYTTCRPGQEDWRLEARELELDFEEEEGSASGPRLRFFDTTILASPWAVFPLGDRRRSGLLTPYYAQTSSRGFEFGIPYYWNIAPEHDATFTPVFMAKRGFQLKNQLRYLERPYAGELKFEYLPDDREFGTSREGVSWQHTHNFPRIATTAQIDYNRVSDDRYFTDLATSVKQLSVGNLPQDAYATHSGALGRAPYSAQLRFQQFQTLQDPLAPIVPPYHRLPQINFSVGYNDLAGALDTALPLEYVRFTHPTLVEGARSSVSPVLAAPFLAPGYSFTPKVGLRHASYGLTRAEPGQPQAPQMSVPWASLDSGLVFERDTRTYGEGSTQTLEPRLFYVYIPYRNQDTIPIFDTALADFNYAQLFTENRFVGGDRFGDANQATVALTSRILRANGQEMLRGTLGQRYYFAAERVGLTPTSPLRSSTDSDVLASLGGRVGRSWTFDATTQYNRHQQRTERLSTAVSYRPEPAKVLNASYRFQRDVLKQVDVSAQWPLATGWYGVGRYNYSIQDKQLLEGLAGIEYNAGCWVFRAVALRVQAAAQVATTAFVFQLEFNGIGTIGTDEAVEILKRNVPGYSVTNPVDAQFAPSSGRPRLPFEQVY